MVNALCSVFSVFVSYNIFLVSPMVNLAEKQWPLGFWLVEMGSGGRDSIKKPAMGVTSVHKHSKRQSKNKKNYAEEIEAYKQKKEEEAENTKKEEEELMKIQKQIWPHNLARAREMVVCRG
ncbi:uncharacterized protein LOC130755348 isoform X2 [Actinidia eriantha]|uniref:uncharacterized protein LOC130755348 isoform X2 n=1 Tax=Actinidia eriantha TaxID=165200 RepID=UPI0025891F1F|nr:uncharacterized protein LOC130755348 isoform X2 [Actinidia eriantha]